MAKTILGYPNSYQTGCGASIVVMIIIAISIHRSGWQRYKITARGESAAVMFGWLRNTPALMHLAWCLFCYVYKQGCKDE